MKDRGNFFNAVHQKSNRTINKDLKPVNAYSSVQNNNDFSVNYMDTVKVEEIKNELIKLANDYNEAISKLFQRLSEVPNVTREWVGNQANYYFTAILPNKNDFLNFGNNLRNISNKLDDDLSKVTGNVSKLIRLEEDAQYNDQI